MRLITEIPIETRATTATREQEFTVGDLDRFTKFTCRYQINSGYDKILSCKESGTIGGGILYYPFELKTKYTEDVNGPAYHIYTNSSYDGSATAKLYDIGVAVGKNQARGICIPASGVDMFLWQLLNAFFPGN